MINLENIIKVTKSKVKVEKVSDILRTIYYKTKEKYEKALNQRLNIVIDGTGASSGPILKRKNELEKLGYKTFMLAIYVSPFVSLERNKNRERSFVRYRAKLPKHSEVARSNRAAREHGSRKRESTTHPTS